MRTIRRRARPGLLDGSASPFEDVSHPWIIQALLIVGGISFVAVLGYHLQSSQRTWQVHPWNTGQAKQRHGREIVILIDSTPSPDSHALRESIRNSWLQWSDHPTMRIECRFLLPFCDPSTEACLPLQQEQATHRDLLFVQHTPGPHRILELYQWIAEHVDNHLLWVIHTTDHTFLRLDRILDELVQEHDKEQAEQPKLHRDAIPPQQSETERFWLLTGIKSIEPTFGKRELRGFVWQNGSSPTHELIQFPYCDQSTFLLSGEIYRHLYHLQDWLKMDLGEQEELILATWLFGLDVRVTHDPRLTVQRGVCFDGVWSLHSIFDNQEMERLYLFSQTDSEPCEDREGICPLGIVDCVEPEGIECNQSGCNPVKI